MDFWMKNQYPTDAYSWSAGEFVIKRCWNYGKMRCTVMILCVFRRYLSDITNDAGNDTRDDAEGDAKMIPRWCEGGCEKWCERWCDGRYEVYANNGENNNMNSDIKVLMGKRLVRI